MKYLNAFFLLAVLSLSWGIFRAYRINQQNLEANNRFKKVYGELKAHPDKLFVCFIDDLKYMKCFDAPKDYPFTNILTLDHPIDIHKQAILKRFFLTSLNEISSSKNVLFVDVDESLFVEYYRKAHNQSVYFSDHFFLFRYSKVKRLLLR